MSNITHPGRNPPPKGLSHINECLTSAEEPTLRTKAELSFDFLKKCNSNTDDNNRVSVVYFSTDPSDVTFSNSFSSCVFSWVFSGRLPLDWLMFHLAVTLWDILVSANKEEGVVNHTFSKRCWYDTDHVR